MTHCTNLVLRGNTYYVRTAIPTDLQEALGKKEVWHSLRTKDLRQARQLAHEKLAQLHAGWALQRQRTENSKSGAIVLSDDDLRRIAMRFYEEEVAQDDKRRAKLPTADDIDNAKARLITSPALSGIQNLPERHNELALLGVSMDFLTLRDAAKDNAAMRRALLTELRKHSASNETALITWAADRTIEREGLPIEKESDEYRRLCLVLIRSWIEALDRTVEHDEGKWGGAPLDPILSGQSATHASASPGRQSSRAVVAEFGESVMELFESYARENPRNVKLDTIDQSRKVVALFAESLPRVRFPAAQIGKKEVREWKTLIQRLPIKAAEIVEFRNLTIREIIDHNGKLNKRTISPRTINKYLSMLSAFCDWLVRHGYFDANPVSGLLISQDKDVQRGFPYSMEQLNKLFASPLFTGCLSEDKWHLPGNVRIDDHRKWLPLIALYSGARLGEIAQLSTSNVRREHGHWIMHVTREGGKTTKTKGSQRVIPVHRALVTLGFIDYALRTKEAGETRLFPKIDYDARGQIAGDYSRAYGRYLAKIGVKTGRGLHFHSFRHTFVDALRRAGYQDEAFGFLIGHTQATTTGRYGILSEGSLKERVKLVEAVEYPRLDLSHL